MKLNTMNTYPSNCLGQYYNMQSANEPANSWLSLLQLPWTIIWNFCDHLNTFLCQDFWKIIVGRNPLMHFIHLRMHLQSAYEWLVSRLLLHGVAGGLWAGSCLTLQEHLSEETCEALISGHHSSQKASCHTFTELRGILRFSGSVSFDRRELKAQRNYNTYFTELALETLRFGL